MTEAEWETSSDATAMLRFMCGKSGERKLRLLACACARSRWSGLVEDEYKRAVEVAERCADGLAGRGDLRAAWDDVWEVSLGVARGDTDANRAAAASIEDFVGNAAELAVACMPALAAGLVREILGNPFRLVVTPGSTSDSERVTKLARRIYDERRFEELPRLADLLSHDGCQDEVLISHLRSPGPHFRGCFALDTILAKGQEKELVTDADWLNETHPFYMLKWWEYFRGVPSNRKNRLLACACCRLISHLMTDDCLSRAIETSEAYADGHADAVELARLHHEALGLCKTRGELLSRMSGYTPEWATLNDLWRVANAVSDAAGRDAIHHFGNAMHHSAQDGGHGLDTVDPAQAALIREILGNSLRQATVEPNWLTSDVLALAQNIYESKDFSTMAIMADALQEAGCTDSSILDHCRDETQVHVRGCWVLDLVLGKA